MFGIFRADLELTGEGWKTRTSMPRCLVSMARLAPKEDRKLLVAAYSTLKGEGMAAAAEDVYTKQPLCFFAVCTGPRPDITIMLVPCVI